MTSVGPPRADAITPADAVGANAGAARGPAALVLGVLLAANVINYADRNVLFPLYDDLRARFHLDNDAIGLLTSLYMVAHAVATLGFGWLGDRRDRRRVLAGGLLLASVASAASAAAIGLGSLAASRVLVGLGTAAIVPVASSILGERFAGPRKASYLALFNLGLFVGGAAGMGLGDALGFPTAPALFAGLGVVVALACLALPIRPRHAGATTSAGPRPWQAARELLAIRTLRWLTAAAVAMAFAAGGFAAWFIDFLHTEKGMSDAAATTLFTFAVLGGLPGIVVGGRLGDRLRQRWADGRLRVIALGMAGSVPCTLGCIYLAPGPALYVVSMLTMFFVVWYHAPMAATIDDLAEGDRSVTAQGLVIFVMHLLGTAPASWLVGRVSLWVGLREAMLVPTAMLAVAAGLILMARRALPADLAAVGRGQGG